MLTAQYVIAVLSYYLTIGYLPILACQTTEELSYVKNLACLKQKSVLSQAMLLYFKILLRNKIIEHCLP